MFGIAQGPAKQTATDAINILSGRLQSATLLEDRRNAVLGLRSFARQYPASVASGALRGLIGSLRKDIEDVDTVKVDLETLLMLFSPDETSHEASEEIALWLADEFTQHQDNITILLDLLEANEFYSRLYSLQLLSAILSARAERTEECIFTAPLGISRLVATLDDRREAIRNEGLSLLTFLTPNSSELQKLVAFESAFDRIFNIIKLEGSMTQGDRVVEDCLILLANLLRMNVSNQSFFRETGCVAKLAQLLSDALKGDHGSENVAEWVQMQCNRNIYALLAVIRLFLVGGGVGTQANQASFWQHGILNHVLQLAFNHSSEVQIKAEALITCADLIRGNASLQEGFAQLQVTSVSHDSMSRANGSTNHAKAPLVYVIDGLLDLTLTIPATAGFDARLAACECIKAYFHGHRAIKLHFLRRAIDGHASGADETANVLTTLLRPKTDSTSNDPYRYWFAAVIIFHLILDDGEAKSTAMSVTEGDSSTGEEVVTCIQTIAANLVAAIQRGEDDRILVGYSMLLCGWLFEEPDAVNDFLGEASIVQSLVQAIQQSGRDGIVVQGLCAILLGIAYEFSTKDSPVPRATLHSILATRMGRDQYIDRLVKFRRHPFLRDFEVLPQKLSSAPIGGLPDVYFDKAFVEFVQDNFSRLVRAIDRAPGMEVPVISNGIQKGISRDMVDSLRSQLEDKDKLVQKTQADLLSYERQLGQEQAEHRRSKETAVLDVTRIKSVNEALQRHHEDELIKMQAHYDHSIQDLKRQLTQGQQAAEENLDRARKRTDAEIADLKANITMLEINLEKANKNHVQDLQTAHEEYIAKITALQGQLERAGVKAKELEAAMVDMQENCHKTESLLEEKEAQRAAAQSELDDLLMVFEDLEDKVGKYKKRLHILGEAISDVEDEDGADEKEGNEEDNEHRASANE